MQAMVQTEYGTPDVLQFQELAKPVPADNEVLIKIHAATAGAWDCEARVLKFPLFLGLPIRLYVGLFRPSRVTILGQELAGEIEAVGKDVTAFKAGDQVFAATGFGFGAYAEYTCRPAVPGDAQGALALKPANMNFEEAAGVPVAGMEALHFLRAGNIQKGEKVLINGAGGSIGTFAVQLAKYFGAEVTAVDSAEKLDMLRSIGADEVIDYRREDYTEGGQTYDVILDVIGKSPFAGSVRSLKANGRYLLANPSLSHIMRGKLTAMRSGKRVISGAASQQNEDLVYLKGLIEAGKLKAVIDRRYPLEQTADAHRYVETGKKKGNVVINVVPNDETL